MTFWQFYTNAPFLATGLMAVVVYMVDRWVMFLATAIYNHNRPDP